MFMSLEMFELGFFFFFLAPENVYELGIFFL